MTEGKGRIVLRAPARTGGESAQIVARTKGWISPEFRLTLTLLTCESIRRQTLFSWTNNRDSGRPPSELGQPQSLSCTNNDRRRGR
jgi:hypothetical protein